MQKKFRMLEKTTKITKNDTSQSKSQVKTPVKSNTLLNVSRETMQAYDKNTKKRTFCFKKMGLFIKKAKKPHEYR